jgi:hypothetical protein
VAIHPGADVNDHLLAHVDAAFECRRAHVWQQHHLAGARELQQLRADCRLVLEHVEAGAGDVAGVNRKSKTERN